MCLLSLIELADRNLKTDTDKRQDDEIQYCLYRGKLKKSNKNKNPMIFTKI